MPADLGQMANPPDLRDGGDDRYQYTRFTTALMLRDLHWGASAPRAGDDFPAFDLAALDGKRIRSDDVVGRTPFLIVLGSLTCPMTAGSAGTVRSLFEEFGERVRFITVFTREAHPGELIPQPGDPETKAEHARRLADRDRHAWTVAVDDVDGSLHRQLDGKPNAVFIVDRHGRLAFRSIWAADGGSIRRALEAVTQGEQPSKASSSSMIGPLMRALPWIDRTVSGGGRSASRDLWRAAPPMALMAKIGRLLPARPS